MRDPPRPGRALRGTLRAALGDRGVSLALFGWLARAAATPTCDIVLLMEEAVVLHDRDGFFGAVLERARGSLRRLGARRVRQGQTWYRDLEADFQRGEIVESGPWAGIARSCLQLARCILRGPSDEEGFSTSPAP